MSYLTKLTEAIGQICPIDGVSMDGTIWYKPEATEAEKIAAQELFETFVESPDPNWAQFRLAMLVDPAFLRVTAPGNCHQLLCGAIASEINKNEPSIEGLQAVHNNILTNCPPNAAPTEEEIANWQSYADSAHCPLTFDPLTGLI